MILDAVQVEQQKNKAGKETRTPDILLGKQTLYQLSYTRAYQGIIGCRGRDVKNGDYRLTESCELSLGRGLGAIV